MIVQDGKRGTPYSKGKGAWPGPGLLVLASESTDKKWVW